jgi:hypothetical protein
MYITINETDYTRHRNLSFSPQTDFTCDRVPINEFSVEIVTTDTIAYGQYAYLYDDSDNIWAKYWIFYAERTSEDAMLIRARSDIALLDGVTLPATMYNAEAISDVLDDVMVRQSGSPGIVVTIDYSIDSSFNDVTITGFCPQQSARERLQWVCFAAGAYVKTFFNNEIEILPIDATPTLVPIEKTFWRPTVNYSDYVTAVKVVGYTFTQGTPSTTDKYVTDGTSYWIVTSQEYTLANNNVPSSAPDNVVKIESVYLINSSNASDILNRLAALYFKRTEVQADVIDNAEYIPGDMLTVYVDEETMYSGLARLCEFSFGRQTRASVTLTASEDMNGAELVIDYQYNGENISSVSYYLPIGYEYSITNQYIDINEDGHRYIYRPLTQTVTGTMVSGGQTQTVACDIALDLYEDVLHIRAVDSVTASGVDTAVIA